LEDRLIRRLMAVILSLSVLPTAQGAPLVMRLSQHSMTPSVFNSCALIEAATTSIEPIIAAPTVRTRRALKQWGMPPWETHVRPTAGTTNPEKNAAADPTELSEFLNYMLTMSNSINQLTPDNFSTEYFQDILQSFTNTETQLLDTARLHMGDHGTSFPVFLENVENQLIKNPGRSLDLVLVTIPTGTLNKFQTKYGIPGLTDSFKSHLLESLLAEGVEVSTNGGSLFISGKSPTWVADHLHGFLERTQENMLNSAYLSGLIREKKKASFENDLRGLRFYASHVALAIKPSSDPNRFKEGTREEDLVHLQHQVENGNNLQDSYRTELAAAADYFLKQPNGRGKASSYTELYIYQSILEAKARAEFAEKSPKNLVSFRDQIIKGNQELPFIDEEAMQNFFAQIEKMSGPKARTVLNLFHDQMTKGRKKMVPLYNFKTGRLPRLMHLIPGYYTMNDVIRTAQPVLKTNGSNASLKEFKRVYARYRFQTYRAVVMAYRDPRLEEVYKLESIDDVLEAQRQGLWLKLNDELVRLLLSVSTKEFKLREDLNRLIQLNIPGLFFFKRAIGDEIGMVIADHQEKLWMGFGELTKANAHEKTHGNPYDLRDTTFHSIFLRLIDVSRPYIGTRHPLEAMGRWQGAVSEVAGKPFQSNDKVEQRGGNIKRPDGYYLQGQDPLQLTYLKEEGENGKVYEKKNGKWVVAKNVATADFVPHMTYLGISQLRSDDDVLPGEAARHFDTFDRLVENQKKDSWLKNIPTSAETVAVKVMLITSNIRYWLASHGGSVREILLGLRTIVPPDLRAQIFEAGQEKIKPDVAVTLMDREESTDGSLRHTNRKRIGLNDKVQLGQILGVFFRTPDHHVELSRQGA
jgi:hypothetical protein